MTRQPFHFEDIEIDINGLNTYTQNTALCAPGIRNIRAKQHRTACRFNQFDLWSKQRQKRLCLCVCVHAHCREIERKKKKCTRMKRNEWSKTIITAAAAARMKHKRKKMLPHTEI